MKSFDNYTVIIYETSKEFYSEVPDNRYVAYLKEIPESSLHEYGTTREDALKNLRVQFDGLNKESEEKGFALPEPSSKDENFYSGKIVLRMPQWLHKTVAELSEEEASSINAYIVNRLIKETTTEKIIQSLAEREERFYSRLGYYMSIQQGEMKLDKEMSPGLMLFTHGKLTYRKSA